MATSRAAATLYSDGFWRFHSSNHDNNFFDTACLHTSGGIFAEIAAFVLCSVVAWLGHNQASCWRSAISGVGSGVVISRQFQVHVYLVWPHPGYSQCYIMLAHLKSSKIARNGYICNGTNQAVRYLLAGTGFYLL